MFPGQGSNPSVSTCHRVRRFFISESESSAELNARWIRAGRAGSVVVSRPVTLILVNGRRAPQWPMLPMLTCPAAPSHAHGARSGREPCTATGSVGAAADHRDPLLEAARVGGPGRTQVQLEQSVPVQRWGLPMNNTLSSWLG